MTTVQEQAFSKQNVRDSFNKAAYSYDQFAFVQQEVCQRLLERLDYIKIVPQMILDVGAGTGQGTQGLANIYPDATIIALDMAEQMLIQNRAKLIPQSNLIAKVKHLFKTDYKEQFVCADAEQLPFADASMDMIFSSLTIQWCTDLNALFSEFRRVLKPGGLLMFTTLGTATLKELKASWAEVSDKQHINQFTNMHEIGDALYNAQVENPVMDNETITLNYGSVKQMMRELKAVGANNHNQGREHALTGKDRFQALVKAYQQFRTDAGLPVTYEILYGHAWNPQTPMQDTQSGTTSISLAQLKSNLHG